MFVNMSVLLYCLMRQEYSLITIILVFISDVEKREEEGEWDYMFRCNNLF